MLKTGKIEIFISNNIEVLLFLIINVIIIMTSTKEKEIFL